MNNADIYEVVVDVVSSAAMLEPTQIHPNAKLIEDMGLDSLALFEIVIDLEDAFHLQIEDETIENLKTCREIAEFIEKTAPKRSKRKK